MLDSNIVLSQRQVRAVFGARKKGRVGGGRKGWENCGGRGWGEVRGVRKKDEEKL